VQLPPAQAPLSSQSVPVVQVAPQALPAQAKKPQSLTGVAPPHVPCAVQRRSERATPELQVGPAQAVPGA